MQRYLILLALLVGCVSPEPVKPETGLRALHIGDKVLLSTEEECYMEIGNIETMKTTGVGWMPLDVPQICGPITCQPGRPQPDPTVSYCSDLEIKPKEGNTP